MKKAMCIFVLLLIVSQCFSAPVEFGVSKLFSDHMVLQRDVPVKIWGWAPDDTKVTVSVGDTSTAVVTDNKGSWTAKFKAAKTGGPHTITIKALDKTVTFSDVWYGDVWLCAGQSNMERNMVFGKIEDQLHRIKPENHDWAHKASARRVKMLEQADTPEIRLFRMKSMGHNKTIGNTPEPRITVSHAIPFSPGTYGKDKTLSKGGWAVATPYSVARFSAVGYSFAHFLQPKINVKIGLIMAATGGSQLSAWTPLEVTRADPKFSFALDHWSKHLKTYGHIEGWNEKNAEFKRLYIEWNKLSPEKKKTTAPPIRPLGNMNRPARMYNTYIHPMKRFAVKGALWYQGEADVQDDHYATNYPRAIAAMVTRWRADFGIGNFPFYMVQLCSSGAPMKRQWAGFRSNTAIIQNAQMTLGERIPNAEAIVSRDLGRGFLHPIDKVPMGERLALLARVKTYGQKGFVWRGPVLKKHKVKEGKVILTFDTGGGKLATQDGKPLDGFIISERTTPTTSPIKSGPRFYWAKTKMTDTTITVWHPKVKNPKLIQYNWSHYPLGNLINEAGQPASCFELRLVR